MTRPASILPGRAGTAGCSILGWHRPLTTGLMEDAGLAPGPLAGVRLRLARAGPATSWHLAAANRQCPSLHRAANLGRDVAEREAGLLDGLPLCRWCAQRLMIPGPEGTYLDLVRHILAAGEWVRVLEHAAPSATWLDCAPRRRPEAADAHRGLAADR